jgi:hypothetical protein
MYLLTLMILCLHPALPDDVHFIPLDPAPDDRMFHLYPLISTT